MEEDRRTLNKEVADLKAENEALKKKNTEYQQEITKVSLLYLFFLLFYFFPIYYYGVTDFLFFLISFSLDLFLSSNIFFPPSLFLSSSYIINFFIQLTQQSATLRGHVETTTIKKQNAVQSILEAVVAERWVGMFKQ